MPLSDAFGSRRKRLPTDAESAFAYLWRRSDGESAQHDPLIQALLAEIDRRYGDSLEAVIVYGSYLRGKRDTILDFYALVEDYRALPRWQAVLGCMLPPNVYHIGAKIDGRPVHAKCAVVRLSRFERAMRSDFHSYFWARFAQPCLIVRARNPAVRDRVVRALVQASATLLRRALPLVKSPASTHDLWVTALSLTYRSELRAEKGDHVATLIDADPDFYRELTARLPLPRLKPAGADAPGLWRISAKPRRVRRARREWWLRRMLGKVLSVARVAKASTMFEAPLDYILWKIERHSGVRVTPTERQRRWPLIFAAPLLWDLYRRGAFR